MKLFFTFSIIFTSFFTNSQVICGTANEGGVVTLTAPAGYVFSSIEFASYGTPNGSCSSFSTGACHAVNSLSIVSAVFLNMNSASINATNGVFGDPCSGTVKRLYIQAVYSLALPLTLLSFTAQINNDDAINLNWSSANETNSSHFIIERSTDGVLFGEVGSLPAIGSGDQKYHYINSIETNVPNLYYRLKMVDLDGRFEYSSILRIDNRSYKLLSLVVFPNPAKDIITITSHKVQEVLITNIHGQEIQKLLLIKGSQTLNVALWKAGVYFLKTEDGIKRIIKE